MKTFTDLDRTTTLGIVTIFETGRALAGCDAVAVLDDGAGISYGMCQFTHRSGALLTVVERYLATGADGGRAALTRALPILRLKTREAIAQASRDTALKNALRIAAQTPEMRGAQDAVADERYLRPAIGECERRSFTLPMSLAVICDSIVHGSFERIATRVRPADEKAWVIEYLMRRDAWLASIPRLAVTRYRTQFFLGEIRKGNWTLRLPLRVHGVPFGLARNFDRPTAAAPAAQNSAQIDHAASPPELPAESLPQSTPRPSVLSQAEDVLERVDDAVTEIAVRTDRAKALWATIAGSIWQTIWAVIGWLAGLPGWLWLAAAVAVALFTALYLYRQIALGKIREAARKK